MILCCGESLVDLIPDRDGHPAVHVGGSVLNTAVALARLGRRVGLLTGLSSDRYGTLIETSLRETGVSTALAVRSDRPTTCAEVAFRDGQPQFGFRDTGSALRELTIDDLLPPPTETQALFFGGISLCNPPVADAFAAYVRKHAANRLVMLDPNFRPGFADDETTYIARLTGMVSRADIVKLSNEDLALLYSDRDEEECIRILLQAGPRLVLLTYGADGARAIHANGVQVSVTGQSVTVIDSVGAGDTFNAGILARAAERGILEKNRLDTWTEDDIGSMLRLGVAAAAVTVSRTGANPPWKHELPDEIPVPKPPG